ncbi:class I adenylate-forming enzyme family protein [Novosphingobium malaysiense]|uniref:AMP-dependent synthetase n=1 Tax=Novosphingobium malaysiense TaxID=1348853 RepID=A0A0B1ZID1_9SPHN|nr:class I adenylate-forming enzyme family protein [Novosphingobium malaysiense]KHK88961.1 hypothetical protein LK12_22985 [Novosphingobium malaysiense]
MTEVRDHACPTDATTFPQLIRSAGDKYGDQSALIFKGETVPDASISFRELERQSATLARGLIARGAGKGSRIGFIAGNTPEFLTIFSAICRIGAIAIPVSTLIKADELVRVLRRSDVGGLIIQPSLLGHDLVERVLTALPALQSVTDPELRLPQVPFLRWIVCTGCWELPAGIRDLAFLRDAANTVGEELLLAIEANVHPADQAIEIYTSGSMALPKGVPHNHGPMLSRLHFLAGALKLEPGMERHVMQPMFWIGGLGFMALPNLERGVTSLCTERGITDSRRAMGSVLAEDDIYKPAPDEISWSIGMTETFGPYAYSYEVRVPGYPLTSPLDHIAPGYELRLWVDGREAAEGEPGEIQVRGYALTPGLHKEDRNSYFEPDGFYRTGDMAVREGKRIHFLGRNGDMIKSADANVSPAEVEMEMQRLENVHSAYVVGIPDAERGQLVVAAVVPRDQASLDFDDIERVLRARLSSFKVPSAYVTLAREEVPMLATNKVARREIERMMIQRLRC